MGTSARGFGSGDGGFTLIELLVVVIILGILAAIAIPVFLAQREQAQNAQAISTVRNAQTALVSYQVENAGFPLGNDTSVTEMKADYPTTDWRRSRGAPAVSMTSNDMVGAVPFERYLDGNPNGAVFGTRSASGECFYMLINASGTRYGRDTQCDDPYETAQAGRISSARW